MKKINVVLALLIVLCFTVSLAGCGSTPAPAQTSESQSGAATSAAATSAAATGTTELAPVTLTWYMVGNNSPDEGEVFAAASKYAKEKINADVNFNVFSFADYDQKMQVKIASSEKFDICFTSSWAAKYFNNVAKGNFMDITDLVPKYAPNKYKAIPPFVWEGLKVNGKLYQVISGFVAWQDAIFTDDSVNQKLGIDPTTIKTYDDLTPILAKVKQNYPDMIPYVLAKNEDFPLANLNLEFAAGDKLPAVIKRDQATPTVTNILDEPAFLKYVDLIRSWYLAGYINNDAATLPDNKTVYQSGKSYANLDACYYKGKEIEWSPIYYNNRKIDASIIGNPYIPANSILSCGNAISVTSDNPERAIMLLELTNTDRSLLRLLGAGIEGKNYKDMGNNFIELTPDNQYTPNNVWAWGDLDRNGFQMNGTPEGQLDAKARSGIEAKPSPILGFAMDYTPVKTQLAQITSVCDEYWDLIINGAVDPKTKIPEFKDKLKKAGLDEFIAETQNQIDKWYAAKK